MCDRYLKMFMCTDGDIDDDFGYGDEVTKLPNVKHIQSKCRDIIYDCYFGLTFNKNNTVTLEVQYYDERLRVETQIDFTGTQEEVWFRFYMMIKHHKFWDIKGEKWIKNY